MKRNLLNDIFPKNELEEEELEEFESLQRELKELKEDDDTLIEDGYEPDIDIPDAPIVPEWSPNPGQVKAMTKELKEMNQAIIENLENDSTAIEKEIKMDEMSNMEKEELKDRFGGMKPAEKEIFLHRLSTSELYEELGRRLRKADKFANLLEGLVNDYKEED